MQGTASNLRRADGAFTLIEVITAVAIFSFILVALSYVLDASLNQLRYRTTSKEVTGNYRTLFDSLRTDVQGAEVDSPVEHSFGDTLSAALAQLVNGRAFLPFEIDRENGQGLTRSFVNAESGYSSLLFASKTAASYAHPLREELRMNGLSDFNQSADSLSEICLIGYYVAYTKDSESSDRYSMKLYRHFRPGGITFGNGHSNGIIAYCGDLMNPVSPRTVLDGQIFLNKQMPFLMTFRYTDAFQYIREAVTQPWPKFAETVSLVSPPPTETPPNYNSKSWKEPSAAIHDFLFPDEIVVSNVLEFQCVPYVKIETASGVVELFDTERLNQRLGLSQDDWPVFVKPDFIDVSLAVLGEEAAVQLTDKTEWITVPSGTSTNNLSAIDRIKRQQTKQFSMRLALK